MKDAWVLRHLMFVCLFVCFFFLIVLCHGFFMSPCPFRDTIVLLGLRFGMKIQQSI